MELTSMETTMPQWSVQDVISTFTPNHMTTVTGLECQNADALAQTIQSILTTPDSSMLASQMQLMQAVTGNQAGGNQVMLMPSSEALPWMVQQYPMMFLPSQVVPGWTQTVAQASVETAAAAATSGDAVPQVQPPVYAQAIQLQFPDGLTMGAHQPSPEFQNSGSVSASPAPKVSTSNSPAPVGLAMTQQPVQLVNGAIGLAHPSHTQVVQQQQLPVQGDGSVYGLPAGYTIARQEPPKPELPKPPKKPLSPYMSFSKAIWSQVKGANPNMSVCEVGAAIGRLWRELDEVEKQKYNNAFTNDKARYDQELQSYLKVTGLQASDLVKPRTKKNHPKPPATAVVQPKQVTSTLVPVSQPQQQVQQQQQQHTHAPGETALGASSETSTIADMVRALPHFSQVWTGPQQYLDQQVLAQLGQALLTNCDGTINLVGVQPQTLNVGDERQMSILYGQSQDLSQQTANSHQLTDPEKVTGASATSVSETLNQLVGGMPWQWHQVQVEDLPSSGQSSSGQLGLSDEQSLARTLLPKLEPDVKPCDSGPAAAGAAAGQSPAVDFSNGSGPTEPDQAAIRESLLVKELNQLRGAVSQKTQEAQVLMQRLEEANRIIEQLRQQRRTMLGHDAIVATSSSKSTESSSN